MFYSFIGAKKAVVVQFVRLRHFTNKFSIHLFSTNKKAFTWSEVWRQDGYLKIAEESFKWRYRRWGAFLSSNYIWALLYVCLWNFRHKSFLCFWNICTLPMFVIRLCTVFKKGFCGGFSTIYLKYICSRYYHDELVSTIRSLCIGLYNCKPFITFKCLAYLNGSWPVTRFKTTMLQTLNSNLLGSGGCTSPSTRSAQNTPKSIAESTI